MLVLPNTSSINLNTLKGKNVLADSCNQLSTCSRYLHKNVMPAPIGENGLDPTFLLILLVCVYSANFYLQTKNNCFSHSATMGELPSKKRRTLSSNDEENGENVRRPYIIERISETRARRYNSEEITFRAKFNDDLQGRILLDVTDDLHDMFQDIMDNVSANHAENNDRARLSI